MKKILTIVTLMAAVFSLCAKDLKTIVFTTQPPMSCENCENKIKGNLRFEKGVKDIRTSVANQEVKITFDPEKTNQKALETAFGKIGYKVSVKGTANSRTATTKKLCPETGKPCAGSDGKTCCSKKKKANCDSKKTCTDSKKVCTANKKACTSTCTNTGKK